MRRLSLTLIAAISLLAACKKSDDSQCAFLNPPIVFAQFEDTDIDTLIFRRYTNNNQFSQLLDTTVFASNVMTRTVVGQDSIILSVPYEQFNASFTAFNWEIVVPGTGSQTRFSNIQSVYNNEEQAGAECHSNVTSVKVEESLPNTKIYSFPNWFGSQYRIYITK
jgi:hypothetical protein